MECCEHRYRSLAQEDSQVKLIQFILIPALLIATLIYIRRLRTLFLDRLIVILLGMSAIFLVLNPEWTAFLAKELGVGRGADLIIYLSITALGFFCTTLWTKLRDIDARLTEMIRHQALSEGSKSCPDKQEK